MEHNTTNENNQDSGQSEVISVQETVIIATEGGESGRSFKERIAGRRVRGILIIILIIILGLIVWRFKGLVIAATVNGSPISRFAVIGELERQSAGETLDFLIDKKLVAQEASRQHIVVTDDEINQVLKKYEDVYNVEGNTLDKTLEAQGLTRNDLKDQITLQKKLEKIAGDKAKVSDEEIQKFIDENKVKLEAGKEEVTKNQIREQIRQQKAGAVSEEILTDLRSKATISRFVKY